MYTHTLLYTHIHAHIQYAGVTAFDSRLGWVVWSSTTFKYVLNSANVYTHTLIYTYTHIHIHTRTHTMCRCDAFDSRLYGVMICMYIYTHTHAYMLTRTHTMCRCDPFDSRLYGVVGNDVQIRI